MDRLVDQAGGPAARDENGPRPPDDPTDVIDDGGSADIESELYCSTREAGIAAVGFTPVVDV